MMAADRDSLKPVFLKKWKLPDEPVSEVTFLAFPQSQHVCFHYETYAPVTLNSWNMAALKEGFSVFDEPVARALAELESNGASACCVRVQRGEPSR